MPDDYRLGSESLRLAGDPGVTVHHGPPVYAEPGRYAAELTWSVAGTPARFTPPTPVRPTGHRQLALRVIVAPNSTGTTLGVTAVGTDGRRTPWVRPA